MNCIRLAPLALAVIVTAPWAATAAGRTVSVRSHGAQSDSFSDSLFASFNNRANERGVERTRYRSAWVVASDASDSLVRMEDRDPDGIALDGDQDADQGTGPGADQDVQDILDINDDMSGTDDGSGDLDASTLPDGNGGTAVPTPSAAIAGLFGLGAIALKRRRKA